LFASVTAVTSVGSGIYQLSVWNGTGYDLVDAALAAGQTFDFTSLAGFGNGVSQFEITGIDPNSGLDPSNVTAFVTGVTFVGDGSFTGTMEAITTASPVPGPIVGAGLPGLLFGCGIGGLLLRRRRVRGTSK
jgi:hypothetical protein